MQNPSEFYDSKSKLCIFCEKCMERIKQISSLCLNDYIIIGDYYIGYGKALKLYGKNDGHISDTLEILERHGYVVTTEISDVMCCVKPIGYVKNDDFHACKRDHLS